ncbi:hypothetical protein KR51_00024690 [Rubidibacter lacunae KORDI 51-2]|uniref:Uncharacterized protein n=1 Tax=Rubidibacter lacunae KORDI 51-2 TaxID=582515 RepID=U5DK62_9CHRO|nr:pilus motility taxis protein HmpF [Rubidibacter lacunae]ERN40964.1 hypothetical protein KR51_00024690 [Rubidibacter lacunae KORDI 51-2]
MLYIVEVKRQTKTFMGTPRTMLKLLGCQRSDQGWSAVQGDETLTLEDASMNFNEGSLLLVDLSSTRQLQGRPELAGAKLVGLLQNLSRLVEKSRGQEEEIEQWKQSLTYQAQELNRREMEMESAEMELEAARDRIESMEKDLSRIEQERADLERLRADLGSRPEFQSGALLDESQMMQLRGVVEQLSAIGGAVLEPAREAISMVEQQQQQLAQRSEQLDRERLEAQHKTNETEHQLRRLGALQQELGDLQTTLDEVRTQSRAQDRVLESKQETLKLLARQLQAQSELRDSLAYLATTSNLVKLTQALDLDALEQMPVEDLQGTVDSLQRDLEKAIPFVNDQEEELRFQCGRIEELQEQLRQAGEVERSSVQLELEEEMDRYRFLEETLVGQRRTLKIRENILEQHQHVLMRRQGYSVESDAIERIDLGPVLHQLEERRAHLEEELQRIDGTIEQLRSGAGQLQEQVRFYESQCASKRKEVQVAEAVLQQLQAAAARVWGQVNASEAMLQQQRDALQATRERLEAVVLEVGGNHYREVLGEVQRALGLLAPSEVSAS